MIQTWTLQNFKSVSNQITLEMAPLTVFAGANSSGKSTLIQSILLTAQTLQSPVQSKSVVLNGHILKFGAFDDVISNNYQSDKISIGFQITPTSGIIEGLYPFGSRLTRSGLFRQEIAEDSTIECNFSFSAQSPKKEEKEVLQLQPRLEECLVKFNLGDARDRGEEVLLVRRSRKGLEKRIAQFELEENLQKLQLESLEYEIIQPSDLVFRRRVPHYRVSTLNTTKLVGVSFIHFLPKELAEVFDEVDEHTNQLIDVFTHEHPYYYRYQYPTLLGPQDLDVRNEFKEIFLEEIKKIVGSADQSKKRTPKVLRIFQKLEKEFSPQNVQSCIEALYAPQRIELQKAFEERRTELYRAARGDQLSKYAVRFSPLPSAIDFSVSNIQQFFRRFVKYLGPLRDEPKPIYPIAGAADSKDVGIRGEHTASVLDVQRNTVVEYVPSKQFIQGFSNPTTKSTTLLEAVLDWLAYMGVASDVKTHDRGKIGREMKVSISGSSNLHDLIHVGVGVSQLLPIIVLSLLAERESTLIFEQPELHLHPRVQTRLADFFLSMTILKKQCIVETHSEYLINRLRYQSAISEGSRVSESVIIHFVEKKQGQSIYRPIKINKYGVIAKWPEGFFDENEANAAEILRAGMEKRKKETRKNG